MNFEKTFVLIPNHLDVLLNFLKIHDISILRLTSNKIKNEILKIMLERGINEKMLIDARKNWSIALNCLKVYAEEVDSIYIHDNIKTMVNTWGLHNSKWYSYGKFLKGGVNYDEGDVIVRISGANPLGLLRIYVGDKIVFEGNYPNICSLELNIPCTYLKKRGIRIEPCEGYSLKYKYIDSTRLNWMLKQQSIYGIIDERIVCYD